ncbi:MAG: alpha/beta hydrolase [Myxococcota bacterium]
MSRQPPRQRSPHPTSRFFETRDAVRLHVLAWLGDEPATPGDESPLVFLHGGGANAHWWDHLAGPLSAGRAVYALDFRGHGDSDHPAERRVGAFNDDLEALVGWLGRDDVILVGHSLGATVALDHASRFAATRALVLVDLARGGPPEIGRRARLALSLRRTYRSREDAVQRFRFLPESSRASEALRAAIAAHSVREEGVGRFGYKFDPGWFGLPSRPAPDPGQIRCPTLLVRGGESTLLTREAAEAFVRSLTGARIPARWVEIPEAGHHVLVDQPERLLAVLEAFLETLPAPSAPGAPSAAPVRDDAGAN